MKKSFRIAVAALALVGAHVSAIAQPIPIFGIVSSLVLALPLVPITTTALNWLLPRLTQQAEFLGVRSITPLGIHKLSPV